MVKTKFSVGDVVQLNGGGPKLTVIDIQALNTTIPASYKVAWFNEGRASATNLPEGSLKKARA